MSAARQSYSARWLFPVDADPLRDATIEIEGGRIAAVHTWNDPQASQLGDVAIIPALVNTHTHLEFSDLRQPLRPAEPFTDWIRTLVAHRKARSDPASVVAARGYREAGESGTALLGEIATAGWSPDAFRDNGPRVVCFRELIALHASQFADQLAVARRHLAEDDQLACLRGISPHAPYSVHPDLFDQLVELAVEFDAPLAIHLAETSGELELLASGSGPLVKLLTEFGLWREGLLPQSRAPIDFLRPLAGLHHALVVHGNYLTETDIAFLAEHPHLTVVYCPRTHDYFGHRQHPWLHMLGRSVSLALGTDSRASNPDLNVWEEIKFLARRFPEVDPRLLLQLGTISGARALGFENELGSLTEGKSADLAVVSLDADASDPYRSLLSQSGSIVRTMCAGSWISNRGDMPVRA